MTAHIALVNPKFPHNVGAVVRAASCYGAEKVTITGSRVSLVPHEGYRLPREERMKGYGKVKLERNDRFFDAMPAGMVPIAVELTKNAEMLHEFEHPENALYVFGPEDGGLKRSHMIDCHRFVVIPTLHCVNLSAAVYTVLYDRIAKRQLSGKDPRFVPGEHLDEDRGFINEHDGYHHLLER